MTVEVRRGTARFVDPRDADGAPGTRSRSAPTTTPRTSRFGPMVCHDDHLLGPGAGFADHPHSDLEIVTWVLSGALRRTPTTGHRAPSCPARCRCCRPARASVHAEVAHRSRADPVRPGLAHARRGRATPAYTHGGGGAARAASWCRSPRVTVRTPRVRLGTASATFWVARLAAGDTVTLPDDPLQHVFVATGALARVDPGRAARRPATPSGSADRPGLDGHRPPSPDRAAGVVVAGH